MNGENKGPVDLSHHLGTEEQPEEITNEQPKAEPETEPQPEVEQPKVDVLGMAGSLIEGYVSKNFGDAFLFSDQERQQWEIIKGALAEKYGAGGVNIPPELALVLFGGEIAATRYLLYLQLMEARAQAKKARRIELGGQKQAPAEGGESGPES